MKRAVSVWLVGFFSIAVLLSGCFFPSHTYKEKAVYATYAFSPDCMIHRLCAYNGDVYYFADSSGFHPNIRKIENGVESGFDPVSDGAVNKDGFHTIWDLLPTTDVRYGISEKYKFYYPFRGYSSFTVDKGMGFANGNIEGNWREYNYYRFYANEPDQQVAILKDALVAEGAEKQTYGRYTVLSDGDFVYVYKEFEDDDYVVGIFERDTMKQIFRENPSGKKEAQSLIYMKGERMIFINRDYEGSNSTIGIYDFDGYSQTIAIPDAYRFHPANIVTQNGKIFMLVQKGTVGQHGSYNFMQYISYNDALASLDPMTGEIEVFYETDAQKERIVGYHGGLIYLFIIDERKIVRVPEGAQAEHEEFCQLPDYEQYSFELCGEKLFVWGSMVNRRGEAPTDDVFIGAFDF